MSSHLLSLPPRDSELTVSAQDRHRLRQCDPGSSTGEDEAVLLLCRRFRKRGPHSARVHRPLWFARVGQSLGVGGIGPTSLLSPLHALPRLWVCLSAARVLAQLTHCTFAVFLWAARSTSVWPERLSRERPTSPALLFESTRHGIERRSLSTIVSPLGLRRGLFSPRLTYEQVQD